MLGHDGRRWEGHEFLRATAVGLSKRYPARGGDAELEVTLLREPLASGTQWHDAQGDCEVLARGAAMAIVNPIPGQESRNSDYLLENGAAIKIKAAKVPKFRAGKGLKDAVN